MIFPPEAALEHCGFKSVYRRSVSVCVNVWMLRMYIYTKASNNASVGHPRLTRSLFVPRGAAGRLRRTVGSFPCQNSDGDAAPGLACRAIPGGLWGRG